MTLRLPFGSTLPPGSPNNPDRLRVIESGRPSVSNLYYGRITQAPLIAITVPVFRQGKIKYALAAPMSPRAIVQLVSQQMINPEWTATIIDKNAVVIGRTKDFDKFLGRTATPLFAATTRQASEGTWRDVGPEGSTVYGGFHRSELSGWSVGLAIPASVAEAPYRRSLVSIAIASVLLLVAGLAFAFFIGRRIARSIGALFDAAEALGHGAIPQASASSIIEVSEVARALEKAGVERSRAEQELRRSEERWRAIFENSAIGIALTDPNGVFMVTNRAYQEMLGYTDEELCRLSYVEITYEEDCPANMALGADLWNGEISQFRHEKRYRRKDGTLIWVRNTVSLAPGTEAVPRFAMAIVEEITERKRAEAELQRSHEKLRALAAYLESVREEERARIAREMHDEIGQALTGIKLTLEASLRGRSNKVKVDLAQALGLANELIGRVRDLSLELRPAMLDDLGLLAALTWHFGRYTTQFKIKVDFKHAGLEGRRFEPELETAAYRIVQEALTNVARHAKVKQVEIVIGTDENMLRIRIKDLGIGFDPDSLLAGATGGLSGMRERAIILGGRLTIDSAPGTGTLLMAELPLEMRVSSYRRQATGY